MTINDFASEITIAEGKRRVVDVAQVSEILKLINKELWGIPYALIRMKRKKAEGQNGEVATAVIIAVAATFLFTTMFPHIGLFKSGGAVKTPSEESWKKQRHITEPLKIGVDTKGKDVLAYREIKEFESGAHRSAAKLSYGERIGDFFASLTIWGFIGLIALFLLFGITPAAIIRWFKNRQLARLEEEKARNDHALENTVAALRVVKKKDPEAWTKTIVPAMDAKHDKEDRIVIDEVKTSLNEGSAPI